MKKIILIISAILFIASCNLTKNIIKIDKYDSFSLSNIKSGSYVKLKKTTIILESHILIKEKSNITIDGNGATLIMKSMSDDVILIENSDNIVLKNFKATHIEPQGPTGCTGNVVHIEGGSNILIENCELNGCGIVGLAAYSTKGLKVVKNYIHKNSKYGIIYQGSSIEINKNTFENNTNGNIFFSYMNYSWPPDELINTNKNKKGLKMHKNVFK